jgi:hypothetical protein
VASFALVFEKEDHVDAVVVKPLLMWEVDPTVALLHQVVACIVVVVVVKVHHQIFVVAFVVVAVAFVDVGLDVVVMEVPFSYQ